MKVLFITVNREHRVAFNIFTPLQQELLKLCDMDIYEKDVGILGRRHQQEYFINPKSYKKELHIGHIITNYDMVITDSLFAFLGEDWDKITIPKMTLIEDQHNQCMDIVKMADTVHKFDYFLVRYRDAFKLNHPSISQDRVFWTPHSVNTKFFKDYEEDKTIMMLSTGSRAPSVYPLREKVYNELNGHPNYEYVPRPKEVDNKRWPMGEDYARLINKSAISFACNSVYGYPVMKIFEIPACRSILCCDYTEELRDLGFKPFKNMIPIAMATQLEPYMGTHLRSPYLFEIMDAGFDLIQERHTVQIRAKELYDFIKEI